MYATTEIALTNDLREITSIASQIDHFCQDHDLQSEVAYGVNLALEELLANTISYGYEDEDVHRIEVLLRLEEQLLTIMVVDDGIPFDPTQAPESSEMVSLDEPEIRGLGLLLVNRMMDGVEYQRRANCNIAILTKSIEMETEDTSIQ
ncbi:MAG: ATP-binding protein [Paracoccaceae bacterium]|nr:ATP-binding protein [Paracoccaceae bacterium]MDE2916025.1 ATP-binding protein [Paracoccaceae bacterium]